MVAVDVIGYGPNDFDASRFDAYLFDAGGILVLPDPTVLGPLLTFYGGDDAQSAHVRAHYAGMSAKSRAGSGERDWTDYDNAYVRSVGVDAEHQQLAARVLANTRSAYLWRFAIADSVQALWQLHQAGCALGVVSNASGQIESTLLAAKVCQVGPGPLVPVRVIIDSEVVGVTKPDPGIFEFALPFFDDVDRARIAYVGDSVTMDVGGARAAGLHPILLDPYDDHPGADFDRIRSLLQLVR